MKKTKTIMILTFLVFGAFTNTPIAEESCYQFDKDNTDSISSLDQLITLNRQSAFHIRNGEYQDAVDSVKQSVLLLANIDETSYRQQIDQLMILGFLYQQTSAPLLAISTFREAQLIIHANEGVHSLNQLNATDWLTLIYLEVGMLIEADRQQEFRYYLISINEGSDSLELVSATVQLAEWYRLRARYDDSLCTYEEAIEIIEESGECTGSFAELKVTQGMNVLLADSLSSEDRLQVHLKLFGSQITLISQQKDSKNDDTNMLIVTRH